MSIMPDGGWDDLRDGQIVHDTPKPTPPVVFVHTQGKRAPAFSSGFGGCLGIICAVVFATVVLVIVVKILNAPPAFRKAAETGFAAPNEPAAAPVIYSVAQINRHSNDIQTGTELNVRGTYDSWHDSGGWAPSTVLGEDGWVVPTELDPCTTLLFYGKVRIEHGEADPRDYCQFSAILQEENTSQVILLECNMGPEELRAAMHKYANGDRVRAHGTYASSLDFQIMPSFGGHPVGIPVLENCTLEPLPSQSAPSVFPVSPTPENIMRAINAEDSSPQNQSKPYPVDADLERDVRQALSASTVLRNAVITPVSLHREVTLSGTVVDESSRELAEEITSQVPGVVAVHNNLTIGAGAPAPIQSGPIGAEVALDNWAKAYESNDPTLIANCYADQVDRYFLRQNVTKRFVHDYMADWLKSHDTRVVMFKIKDAAIYNQTPTYVQLRLVKEVVTKDSEGAVERFTPSELSLKKVAGEWKITSERDFK